MDMAKGEGVKMKEGEVKRSELFVKNQIKALIARAMWRNEGFYTVSNANDELLQNAVLLFPKSKFK
jgi:carboxyl-terminal processing protease